MFSTKTGYEDLDDRIAKTREKKVSLLMVLEDCIYKAKWGMKEHMNLLKEHGLPVPPGNKNPKIIIQNQQELEMAV